MIQQTETNEDLIELIELIDLIEPMLARVAELDPRGAQTPEQVHSFETALEAGFPYAGEAVQAVGQMIARGVQEGWLANRGEGAATFSRVSKPSAATHQMSVDVVSMTGAGLAHTHTLGEITLGFPALPSGEGRFEGRPPGWVFLGPGSRHVPTVAGDRMNLIYFLPEGAVEWHRG